MLRTVLVISGATAIVGACSLAPSHTVERPAAEVRAMIQANENSLRLTHFFPSANHKTEHEADGLVWRFTLNDRDYARMVIKLRPRDALSTRVTSRFETVNDAVGPAIPFLRRTARATSEEIIAATVEGRPVNHALLQDQLKVEAAKDPQIMARAYMEASAEMFKEIQATGGTFSSTSNPAVRSSQPYDKRQPYDRTPAYDR